MKNNIPRTATLIRGKMEDGDDKSAQIVVDKGIFAANTSGTGLAIDDDTFEVSARHVKISPSSSVTVWDAPLNSSLIHSEMSSKEIAGPLRRDCYAGEVMYDVSIPHRHRYSSIKVPPVYKSRTIDQLKSVQQAVSSLSPIGDALDGNIVSMATSIGSMGDVVDVDSMVGEIMEPLGRFQDTITDTIMQTSPMSWEDVLRDIIIKVVSEHFGFGGLI